MSQTPVSLPRPRGLAQTMRRDAWWLQPLFTFLGLGAFIVYSTWAAFQGDHYWFVGGGASYLSPFYSPEFWYPAGQSPHSPHAWFGEQPSWLPWPSFVPFSPALLILWAPGGFRFTCYYYRGAYYKAFWGDPPACAVGEPGFRGEAYRGEHKFPLLFQNIHRFFMRLALPFLLILAWDAIEAYRFTDAEGSRRFGIAVGSLILTLNPIFLASYTLGCHSLRHLIGGREDCLSRCSAARQGLYAGVSCLNHRHMMWAWISLFWVGFTDFYVRMCSMGVWEDLRIL